MRRGQALEYLTTYGYALAVVFFIIGGLVYFNIVNPGNFLPDTCVLEKSIPCSGYDIRKTSDGAAVLFYIKNEYGFDLENVTFNASVDSGGWVNCEYSDGFTYQSGEVDIPAGTSMEFYCAGLCGSTDSCANQIRDGDKRKFYLYGQFIPEDGRFRRSLEGFVRGALPEKAGVYTPPVDNTNPTVSITSPSGGLQSGLITVFVSATDDNIVTSVRLRVDGVDYGSVDNSAPYQFSLDTTNLIDGTYTLDAYATDQSGNIGYSSTVDIDVLNALACIDITSLNSYWRFDDARDLSLDSTTANDLQTVTADFSFEGVEGGALNFTPNQYARPQGVTFTRSFTQRTLAGWIYVESLSDDYTIFEEGGLTNGFYVGLDSGDFYYATRDAGVQFDLKESITTGWHHFAATYYDNNMTLYLDGVEQNYVLTSYSPVEISNHPDAAGMGRTSSEAPDAGVGQRYLDGLLDEVMHWDRALTPAEIAAIAGGAETCGLIRDYTYQAEDLIQGPNYNADASCICAGPSAGGCAENSNPLGVEGHVNLSTWNGLGADYNIGVTYCDENDDEAGADSYRLLVNDVEVHSWSGVIAGPPLWKTEVTPLPITLNPGDVITIASTRSDDTSFARLDYITFTEN